MQLESQSWMMFATCPVRYVLLVYIHVETVVGGSIAVLGILTELVYMHCILAESPM
jgi:uncharacterized membrane protein YphA (DoxX/SURF4 family)